MNFEFCILTFAFVVVLCVSALIFLILWIAKGEPDTNGDPERDARSRRREDADPRITTLRNRVDEVIKPNPILEAERSEPVTNF